MVKMWENSEGYIQIQTLLKNSMNEQEPTSSQNSSFKLCFIKSSQLSYFFILGKSESLFKELKMPEGPIISLYVCNYLPGMKITNYIN